MKRKIKLIDKIIYYTMDGIISIPMLLIALPFVIIYLITKYASKIYLFIGNLCAFIYNNIIYLNRKITYKFLQPLYFNKIRRYDI